MEARFLKALPVKELQSLFAHGAMGSRSDAELLGIFVSKPDEVVFEAIIRRHGPMVWGVCRRVLRDHHDAEDAFQATFLVLARKAASITPREKLGNWLYGVAYQTARKARATTSNRKAMEKQVPDMPEPVADREGRRDDLLPLLDQELSRLPKKYRLPIVLCDLEGKTHKQAAEQLGWPIGTVSGRLSRGRTMLGERLTRRGFTLAGGSLAMALLQGSASAGIGMPTRLFGSTARAASLFAAGAEPAGMVSAGVAALTREVLKMMLLSKLKVATLLFLVLTGTGLIWNGSRAAGAGPSPAPTRPDTPTDVGPNRAVEAAKSPVTELEGTWVLVSIEREGKTEGFEQGGPMSMTLTFRGDHYEVREQKVTPGNREVHTETGRFIVDEFDGLKAVTMVPPDGKRAGVVLALYRMGDGMLKLCGPPSGSGDRPQSFDSDEKRYIETFKRGEGGETSPLGPQGSSETSVRSGK
ncbi:sigma-70 family RNA polymerase sigma factor [Isosphaeraceae bacterium EP7]